MPSQSERRLVVHVDLRGNTKLGPEWLEVCATVAVPPDWTDERIRKGAAEHYGVPIYQVDDPYPKTWDDDKPCPECEDEGSGSTFAGCGTCGKIGLGSESLEADLGRMGNL